MRQAMVRPGEAGFTVLELLTVLVILGIVLAWGVPSMQGFADRTRTRRALDGVVADLAQARLLAIEQGRPVAFRVGGTTYSIEAMGVTGDWELIRSLRLGDGSGVPHFTGQAVLEFSSRGLVTNRTSEWYVTVEGNGARDSIYVSPAGRVYRDY